MALIDFKVLPGIDKQDTTSGAENRWVDCDNTVKVGFNYDGSTFTSNKPTAEEIATFEAEQQAKETDKASGNQKLLDLGLTQAEATALTGYTPPEAE